MLHVPAVRLVPGADVLVNATAVLSR
jgi:hypothetical protein